MVQPALETWCPDLLLQPLSSSFVLGIECAAAVVLWAFGAGLPSSAQQVENSVFLQPSEPCLRPGAVSLWLPAWAPSSIAPFSSVLPTQHVVAYCWVAAHCSGILVYKYLSKDGDIFPFLKKHFEKCACFLSHISKLWISQAIHSLQLTDTRLASAGHGSKSEVTSGPVTFRPWYQGILGLKEPIAAVSLIVEAETHSQAGVRKRSR